MWTPYFEAGIFVYACTMPVSNDYFQYVIEQLDRLPQVTSRRMFGIPPSVLQVVGRLH